MALNKNALIRYQTIDKCLQNQRKQWTLEDLIESCSDALYEYEGRSISVSKRTIQLDIQMLRSDKLGYNAPIEVYDKKFYRYADPNYSITNIGITENDINVLSESVEMLKQFKNFSFFSEVDDLLQRLEDKVYSAKENRAPIIHLDKNEQLKGLEHLETIYQAILKKTCLQIKYQSFKARTASNIIFHPFILKQFNNRWFVIGKSDAKTPILNLALDRIIKIKPKHEILHIDQAFDADSYYQNTIGVTVLNDDMVKKVVLKFDRLNAPYVLTKPLHHSQEVIEEDKNGEVTIQIKVHLNFELERLILGFGNSVEVLKPKSLRKKIKKKLEQALSFYSKSE